MVDLGPFIDPDAAFGPEWGNPLFYFNLGAFIVSILLLRQLAARRDESGLAGGAWAASLVLCIGSGLHFLGDLTAVSEKWDHQFIHLVVLLAVVAFYLKARSD